MVYKVVNCIGKVDYHCGVCDHMYDTFDEALTCEQQGFWSKLCAEDCRNHWEIGDVCLLRVRGMPNEYSLGTIVGSYRNGHINFPVFIDLNKEYFKYDICDYESKYTIVTIISNITIEQICKQQKMIKG